MRERVDQLGVAEPEIQTTGGNQITVGLPDVQDTPARRAARSAPTAQLYFYDWEANALTPNGKTVASQLRHPGSDRDRRSARAGRRRRPGTPGAGSLSALPGGQARLQAAQVGQPCTTQSRKGPQYYLFGAPGSAACAAKAKATGTTPVPGQHCLLTGPDNETSPTSRSRRLRTWPAAAAGVDAADGQVIVVQQGTVVLQAANPTAADQVKPQQPQRPSSSCSRTTSRCAASDITNPQPSTDQGGNPDVQFGFNGTGKNEFSERDRRRSPTAAPDVASSARRSTSTSRWRWTTSWSPSRRSTSSRTPTGSPAAAAPTSPAASPSSPRQDLATQLRLGALPINLKLISESQVSATLGKQALHQGLVAGLRRADRRGAVPDLLLPRARPDRRRRPGRLRPLLLRADQADPDHADAARDRRSDPDHRRGRRRQHRHLRTRQGGDPGRDDRSGPGSRPATGRA